MPKIKAVRNHHPYTWVDLQHLGFQKIDNEIVDLIKGLFDMGWYTYMSCQKSSGRVWVQFDTPYHAEQFMNFIMLNGTRKLRDCVRNSTPGNYDKLPKKHRWVSKGRWHVDANVHHGTWTMVNSQIHISIRFPKKHLAEVTKLIRKEVNKKRKADEKRKAKRLYISD